MIVIIDNYDSFTYNLYQYIGEINPNIKVFRNDKVTIEELKKLDISHIVISPGPGTPKNSGISKNVIKEFGCNIPILGVCLGHQTIGEIYGCKITNAKELIHGKTSIIYHNGEDIFRGIKNPLKVTRYHSLIVDNHSDSDELIFTAKTEDGVIMALRHKIYPIFGVQFHPEAIATNSGKQIIENFLRF
ncbi:anthranilate synthase component II [Paramaledivibacter caminithermalis]|jgi:anthranilate synthase/aminodeoxychorismate synthase-like glutamine amidotransferase|uniref:Anthranilate synthase, component II n=1 Tax=Paramaledivibacter caminithermalis (strain DSM 15212 / CIP 107654 / DViRD3) TaxID=1121301 RepID=A0A1M6RIY1_PARC5|nr:aminodeoxychorismate/anthranilate synthase component II [Paramaledivibacter caminithermalis]SHK32376.1 anthranilate synthase, component II [Paramaledivibacter caminithermalis DSM 15212]